MNMEWERRRFDAVQVAEIKRASIHTAKIAIPCSRFDNDRCFTGQYMTLNVSRDMNAAEVSEAYERKVSKIMRKVYRGLLVFSVQIHLVHSRNSKPTW